MSGVEELLEQYTQSLIPERRVLIERYRLADAAYKVVGVGSVGTLCGVALMVSGDGETLQLQFKEADASVLEAAAQQPSPYANHGERVVRGQRLLQAACDILLGFGVGPRGKDIYVRQLRDAKVKPVLDTCRPSISGAMPGPAARCWRGPMPARPTRSSCPPIWARALPWTRRSARSRTAYAKQTESDHAALQQAIKTGRLPDAAQDS